MRCVILSYADIPCAVIADPGKDNEFIGELVTKGHKFKAEWCDTNDDRYTKAREIMDAFFRFQRAIADIDKRDNNQAPRCEPINTTDSDISPNHISGTSE